MRNLSLRRWLSRSVQSDHDDNHHVALSVNDTLELYDLDDDYTLRPIMVLRWLYWIFGV